MSLFLTAIIRIHHWTLFLAFPGLWNKRIVILGKGVTIHSAVGGAWQLPCSVALARLLGAPSPSVFQMAPGHKQAWVAFVTYVWQSCSKGTDPQRTTKNSNGRHQLSSLQGDCLGVLPAYPPSGSWFLCWVVGAILGPKPDILWMGKNPESPPQRAFWHWPRCLKLQTLLQTLASCILLHLCFIFSIVFITIWHTMCFTYSSFIVFPPPLDCKFYESSHVCLFCSLLHLQYLGKYMAYSRCSINVREWVADRSWHMACPLAALCHSVSEV